MQMQMQPSLGWISMPCRSQSGELSTLGRCEQDLALKKTRRRPLLLAVGPEDGAGREWLHCRLYYTL